MGFSNESRGGERYINFKKGKMFNDGKEYTSFEGELVEIEIAEGMYEGKPYPKVILYLWEPEMERIFQMEFSMSSGYGFSFFAMLPNIDPSKPLKISSGMNELKSGHSSGVLFAEQDGESIKWFYSKTNNPKEWAKIPEPKIVKKATAKSPAVVDYEEKNNFMEKVYTAFQSKKLSELYPRRAAGFKSKSSSNSSSSKRDNDPDPEIIDDLPF